MDIDVNKLPHEDGSTIDPEKDDKKVEKEFNKTIDKAEKLVDEINSFHEKLILPEVDLIEDLNEAVPKELIEPFKRARATDRAETDSNLTRFGRTMHQGYKNVKRSPDADDGQYYDKLDLAKSNYTPITPEEAKELKKNGEADKVLVILGGQLVAFNKDGKQLYRADRSWDTDSNKFRRPNGDIMPHSGKLTFGTVLDHADKIYKADEVLVPRDVLLSRRANPESSGYLIGRFNNRNLVGQNTGITNRSNGHERTYTRANIEEYKKQIKNLESDIVKYQEIVNDESGQYTDDTKDLCRNRIQTRQEDIKYYTRLLNQAFNYKKDSKARARYYNSEAALREPFNKLAALKNEIGNIEFDLKRASANYNNVKTNGAKTTSDNKARLERLQQEMKRIAKEVTEVEILLDGCEEDDAEELAIAQAKLDDITAEKDSKQAEIDALLRKNKTEELEESILDEDIPALNKIKEAGKVGKLNDLLSELYPEGITDNQLKDILTYEQDFVLSSLGIGDKDE